MYFYRNILLIVVHTKNCLMKKLALLFALCIFSRSSFSQTNLDLYATGAGGSYTTGSATASTRTDGDILVTSTTENGYAVFDLSSIPAGSVITASSLLFYVSAYTAGVAGPCNTYGYPGDLSTVTVPGTLFSDITSGSLLYSATPPAFGSYGTGGYDSIYADTAGAPIIAFVQANIGNKVSIGFTGGGTNVYTITGEGATPGFAPILRVSYVPACTGTPTPGYIISTYTEACPTTTVNIANETSYDAGVTYQWQSSPDSATWTNIAGATTAGYNFTGLAATTYYRCQNTCTYSGLSVNSPGFKITYMTTCCTGTPPIGVASASTTYCSSCSLTLNLSGYAIAAGMNYQWEMSYDNVTWGSLWGANSVSYTFPAFGACYYRCQTTCGYSGLSSYSSTVFVGYQYHITADSVNYPSPYACDPPQFYTEVNGSSSLLAIKTYYGDGTTDSVSLVNDTVRSYINTPHSYSSPGIYTVKRVLYYANTAQDSATEYYSSSACNVFPVTFYLDANGDCSKEATEHFNGLPISVRIDSSGVTIDTASVTSGFYYITHAPVGTIYSFTVFSTPGSVYVSCPSSGIIYDTVHAASGTYSPKQIALNCISTATFDLGLYTVNQFTRGNHQGTRIYMFNTKCTPVDAVVTVYFSPKYVFTGEASPSPSSVSGNSLSWNVFGMSSAIAGDTTIYYQVENSPVTGHLYMGDTVHSMYTISPVIGDIDSSNNSEMVIDSVTESYDPNEMSVFPSGCITSDTDGTILQYSILFTNVGNDTAFNIHVMDTLSDNVDPKSLQILMASNTMNVATFNDGAHNIVKFDFPNINLLDSSACPHCSGSVIFKIKTKQGLAEGTTIFNRAGVYFDDNPVIMTNTVEDVKGGCFANEVNSVKAASTGVQILPNPAADILTIKTDQNAYSSFVITNSVGQEMLSQPLTQTVTKVNINRLPAGLYYITFRGENGTEVKKFVKL